MQQRLSVFERTICSGIAFVALAFTCGTGADSERIELNAGDGGGSIQEPGPASVAPEAPLPERVVIELTDGGTCTIHQIKMESDAHPARYQWSGVIEGEPGSEALFAVYDDHLSGVLRIPGASAVRVETGGALGEFRTEVFEDEHGHAPCKAVALPAPTEGFGGDDPQGIITDAVARGSQQRVFDLLVAYTQDAKVSEGGLSGIHAEIDLAVFTCNRAFTNSGINARVRLVRTMLVEYDESGSAGADLSRFRSTTDGIMDEVHQARQDAAADLVALLVRDFDACGRAYIMQSLTTSFRASAFSVTDAQCAVGNQTFIHEIGHNIGCAHNREDASSAGVHNYSFGHRQVSENPAWRTIMSYAPGQRLSYFSNPLIDFNGEPLGMAMGSRAADNARSIGTTSLFIEAFLDETTRQPYAFELMAPDDGAFFDGPTKEVSWEEIGPVQSYTVLIDDTPEMSFPLRINASPWRNSVFVAPGFVEGDCGTLYWTVEANIGPGIPPVRASSVRSIRSTFLADLNDDGVVDCADLGGLVGRFGSTGGSGDLNNDGIVDSADLGIMIREFGAGCSP